jgi:hypothetical protein
MALRLQNGEAPMNEAAMNIVTNTRRVKNNAEQIAARTAPRNAAAVEHPPHYNSHPSGIECITVTEHMNFNLGNAMKYIWRAGLKSDDDITDLEKSVWYVQREIARLKAMGKRK